MTTEHNYNFIRPTLRFCIAGIFIPCITVVVVSILQNGLESLGVECSNTWGILWVLTAIGAIAAPIIFIRLIKKWLSGEYHLTTEKLLFFNILEYILLQCAFVLFFISARTLCYSTDGQLGFVFVFTGWMALPILIVLSLVFDRLRREKIAE
jgi:hypothetical protein